jgi:hypothetical protein
VELVLDLVQAAVSATTVTEFRAGDSGWRATGRGVKISIDGEIAAQDAGEVGVAAERCIDRRAAGGSEASRGLA